MRIAVFLAVAALSGAARADEVFLLNGQSLTGRVVQQGKQVVVEVAGGTIRLAAKDVERIEKAALPEDLYAARAAGTDFQDPAAIRALAAYAVELKLPKFATQLHWMANDVERDLFEKRIEADPEDAEARVVLARLDREERAARERAEAEARRRADEELAAARHAAAAAQAEAARLREEAERERERRIEAERQVAAAQRDYHPSGYWDYGWGGGFVVGPGGGGGGHHNGCPKPPRPPMATPAARAPTRPPPYQTPWQLRVSPLRH